MAPPADKKTPFKIDKGNRCVKCGKEIDRSVKPYCPDCRRSRPPTPGHRRYRWALFPEKLEPGRAGLFKARAYLFFVGVLFVAIGLICVLLVTEPEAGREMSEVVGFGVPRIIWAALGGAAFTLAIGLFYAAVTGRMEKKWILRLIRLLGTDVPDWG
ncbi:MAG: hypothetical protein ACYTAO_05895 [Planctomycetota bacterium]|jgi:hypothetical protein